MCMRECSNTAREAEGRRQRLRVLRRGRGLEHQPVGNAKGDDLLDGGEPQRQRFPERAALRHAALPFEETPKKL